MTGGWNVWMGAPGEGAGASELEVTVGGRGPGPRRGGRGVLSPEGVIAALGGHFPHLEKACIQGKHGVHWVILAYPASGRTRHFALCARRIKEVGKIVNWRQLALMVCIITAVPGCTRMYTLPDAPPEQEWTAAPKKEVSQEELTRRFLDAKRAAIQCFAALADRNWVGAMAWMSARTVTYFDVHSASGGAAGAFDAQTLMIDGAEVSFDPVADIFIGSLADIRDDFGGREDDESEFRKVLYAVSRTGEARAMVFVYEDERWKLDAPFVRSEILPSE